MFDTFIIDGTPHALFWAFVGTAVIIQGISKSGFAGGAGILSLPLMMLVMPAEKVPATLLPLLILCDMNAIYIHRRNVVWRKVLEIYLPAILGILAGAWVWWQIGKANVAQYEVPLFQETITGVVFLDTGTVTEDIGFDEYRVSAGVGVRLYIPQLGPVPIAFDFGFPIVSESTDQDQVMTFTAELPF